MKIPCLLPNQKFYRIGIFSVPLITLFLFITFFNFSIVYAASPINENIIKYRFFVKTLSAIPELKNDCVLPFELDCTYHVLKSEVIRASKDYNTTLDYIVDNFHLQPQKYEEFLKMLREKLAAEGIFPAQFNELRLDSNNADETTTVQFLELRNKILEARDDEPGDSIEVAYKKAVIHMKLGYDFYCRDDYSKSSSEFGLSIEHWHTYYKLSGINEQNIKYVIARIRTLQGCILVDGEYYENARTYFDEAIKIFLELNDSFYANYTKIFKAEIYYRQNQINEFIYSMKAIQLKNPRSEYNSHSELSCRGNIIYDEYYRLKYTSNSMLASHVKQSWEYSLKTIDDLKKRPHLNQEYIKKFLNRYEKILEYNSFEIVSLSFESKEKYIVLKDHITKSVIEYPQWQKIKTTQNNHDYISIKKQPVALITGNKLEFFVGIYSLTGANPTWDLVGRTIINGKEVKFKNRGVVSRAENVFIHKFESEEDFTNNRVKVVPLEIEWWLRTFDKNRAKEFSLGKTSHKVYVVRKKIAEPCYWQIVEYTCDWMKDLSTSQLTDNRNVIDAIWNGCSLENLNKLQYRYQYPALEGEDNGRLPELLKNKRGKCGQWALFFRHCLYCQGVKNVNTVGTGGDYISFYFIKYQTGEDDNQECQYYENYPFIGMKTEEKMPYFSDHALVGYGGKVVQNSQYGQVYEGGELFDIVFHQRVNNSSPLIYENTMVENIKDDPNIEARKKILTQTVQEFLLLYGKSGGAIDPAPEKSNLNEVINNE